MNKRRRLLVYTGFQVKYIVSVVVLAALTLGALGYLYGSTKAEERQLLGLQGMTGNVAVSADQEKSFEQEMKAQFKQQDKKKVVTLVVASAVLVLLLALVALRMTHRIAGPVYMVSNTLKAMAMGSLKPVRNLRKRDEFTFLTDDLRALREALLKRQERVVDLASNVLDVLGSIEISNEEDRKIVDELASELKTFIRENQVRGEDG